MPSKIHGMSVGETYELELFNEGTQQREQYPFTILDIGWYPTPVPYGLMRAALVLWHRSQVEEVLDPILLDFSVLVSNAPSGDKAPVLADQPAASPASTIEPILPPNSSKPQAGRVFVLAGLC
jgi:hypothetical protein